MLKRFFNILLAVLFLSLPSVSFAIEELKLSMELWNRYEYVTDGEFDSTEESGFELARGYFRIEPKFNSRIKGRFNLDFFSGKSSGFADGAGLKIKYAYLDIKLYSLGKLTVGLLKHYFGSIYSWNYETIQKDPADKYKVAGSTDYGLAFNTYLPKGFGDFQLGIYNGEGYKKGNEADRDMFPELLANLRFIPYAGITLGGSISWEDKRFNDSHGEYLRWAGYGEFAVPAAAKLRIILEYLSIMTLDHGKGKNAYKGTPIFMAYVSISPIKWITILHRTDWVTAEGSSEKAYNRYIGGIDVNIVHDSKFNPVVWLQLNYEGKWDREDDEFSEHALKAQMRWKFGHKWKFD